MIRMRLIMTMLTVFFYSSTAHINAQVTQTPKELQSDIEMYKKAIEAEKKRLAKGAEAYNYFIKLQKESVSGIERNDTGNALQDSHNSATRGANAPNSNAAKVRGRISAEQMPGDVSGMVVDKNKTTMVREALIKAEREANMKRFEKASLDEKQNMYNETLSKLEYKQKEIVKLNDNYSALISKDKEAVKQIFEDKSKELNAEEKDLNDQIAELEKICPDCVKK